MFGGLHIELAALKTHERSSQRRWMAISTGAGRSHNYWYSRFLLEKAAHITRKWRAHYNMHDGYQFTSVIWWSCHTYILASMQSLRRDILRSRRQTILLFFLKMAFDQLHQQNNAVVREDGGAIGLTESPAALQWWMASGPEMAGPINEFKTSVSHPQVITWHTPPWAATRSTENLHSGCKDHWNLHLMSMEILSWKLAVIYLF